MKILVIGAAGNCGTPLVKAGLKAGHAVTAFVRTREKFLARIGGQMPSGLTVAVGDATDQAALAAAMTGQDAVINAAGIVSDGPSYIPLVRGIIATAARTLGAGGRFWLFGGLPVLDLPGTQLMGVDIPGLPAMYMAHRTNYEAVNATDLDWSMLAPGRMVEAPNGAPHDGLLLSTDTWPIPGPSYLRFVPRFALMLPLMPYFSRFTIAYEDSAKVIIDHLARNGPFRRKRVGLALPPGVKLATPQLR
jgi:hypothetical protein